MPKDTDAYLYFSGRPLLFWVLGKLMKTGILNSILHINLERIALIYKYRITDAWHQDLYKESSILTGIVH